MKWPRPLAAHAAAAGALDARAAAIEALAARPLPRERVARVGRPAWDLFFAVERCALPLGRVLAASGETDALPETGRAALAAATLRELHQVLAARRQLRLLGAALASSGIAAIALKGAVHVHADDESFGLTDIDLLVAPEQALAAAELLDAMGYRPYGGDSAQHLATRLPPARAELPVEIHRAPHHDGAPLARAAWDSAIALAAAPGLRALAPVEHAWQVLVHAAVDHGEQFGRLRDLLLLRQTLARLAPHDVDELRTRVARHPGAPALARFHDAAARFGAGDPYRTHAGVAYGLGVIGARIRSGDRQRRLVRAAQAALGAGMAREALRAEVRDVGGAPRWALARALDRLAPAPTRAARRGARIVRHLPALALGLLLRGWSAAAARR